MEWRLEESGAIFSPTKINIKIVKMEKQFNLQLLFVLFLVLVVPQRG